MVQNRISELRNAKGLTQQGLGELAGTTKQTIHKLEKGTTGLTLDWMYRLAPHLGVEPHELVPSVLKANPTKKEPITPSALLPFGATPLNNVKKDLPVLGRPAGAKEGVIMITVEKEPVDWALRPPQLDGVRDAFAILQNGDSMDPKYCNGDTLWIHPAMPIRPGNGILIIKNNDEAVVKVLVRRTEATLTVRHLYPTKEEFDIPRTEIREVYKVIGCLSG